MNGAHVLEEIFNEFSETRESYTKVVHGIALTDWLIGNHPSDLSEVAELLEEALSGVVTAEDPPWPLASGLAKRLHKLGSEKATIRGKWR